MVNGITIDADGPVTESVTLDGVDELKSAKVGQNGQVYVGRDYGGKQVLLAIRVEDDEAEVTNEKTDSKATEEAQS
jgi:hypothetical protein